MKIIGAILALLLGAAAQAQVLPLGPNGITGGPQLLSCAGGLCPSPINPGMGPDGSNSGVPSWVLTNAVVDLDFANTRYFGCSPAACLSVTRASTGYCLDNTGLATSFSSNVLRICFGTGLLIEAARTNLALWARDLTQSGTWVAVTMTAALNAVGIDGAANSATTLTSTSAAGTILQSLTAASTAYTYTVYVKGVTVTGNIQVADYPVLTPAFTTLSASNCFNSAGVGTAPASGQSSFLKCTVTATSLNPVIGFKFANNGDSIVVDFNQLEAASSGTSPILTTTTTQARASDLITLTGLAKTTVQGASFYAVASVTGNAGVTNDTGILETNIDELFQVRTPTSLRSVFGATTLDATLGSGSFTTTLVKNATGVAAGARSLVANNGTVVTDATSISADTSFFYGSFGNGAGFPNAYYPRLTLGTPKPTDVVLKGFTQ